MSGSLSRPSNRISFEVISAKSVSDGAVKTICGLPVRATRPTVMSGRGAAEVSVFSVDRNFRMLQLAAVES